jgi:hypothetical protein
MSNVLSEAKKQQVIALGRLGRPLRRIEQETGVRRETAGAYLKAAGIGVRPPGAWGRRPPAEPANENEVTTGSDAAKPTPTINPNLGLVQIGRRRRRAFPRITKESPASELCLLPYSPLLATDSVALKT